MSTIQELLQAGNPDLELAAVTTRVLIAPYTATAPLTTIEDATNGGLDKAKVGRGTSAFVTVGNYEKKAGVRLSNKPTINKIMSAGYGSPTRFLASESEKSITYTPQQTNLWNLQNAWGFTPDAISGPSTKGGITIGIPELPANLLWRTVLVVGDVYNGLPIYMYWISNRTVVGDRQDIDAVDSDVLTHGVTLNFQTDPAVELPVIFGICGDGWKALNESTDTGLYAPLTGITVTPSTKSLVLSGIKTQQLAVVDSNTVTRTALATYVSANPAIATVSSSGLITGVATGSTTVTATFHGFTGSCAVTVTA
ncbi:MAG: Ig-like domain-containing protein [Mycobacteriaceae bacterium]|nr:Ig-like domain-containing protein [Mycobacteriaceae bacterium]